MTSPKDSDSKTVLQGRPAAKPARVIDFEELDKKSIDALVDALKYIATTCGIVIAVYSQNVREFAKEPAIQGRPSAQLLLFAPLLFWFSAIIATVIGILPREYVAASDAAKEMAIRRIRKQKKFWLRMALISFIAGFALFLLILAAQIWRLPPFATPSGAAHTTGVANTSRSPMCPPSHRRSDIFNVAASR